MSVLDDLRWSYLRHQAAVNNYLRKQQERLREMAGIDDGPDAVPGLDQEHGTTTPTTDLGNAVESNAPLV